jgi:hypothetical protein
MFKEYTLLTIVFVNTTILIVLHMCLTYVHALRAFGQAAAFVFFLRFGKSE